MTKVYKDRNAKTDITAVDDCSLLVSPGECFGLLGVNGAGKSTLFQLITGKLDVTRGRILVNGFDALCERRMVRTHLF